MSALDWVIAAFTLLLAVYGYVQGFIVGALSLVGFGLGAFAGTRVAPLLLSGGDRSAYAPLFGLLGGLLAGGALASGLEGLGAKVRSALRLPGLRTIDGLLGAGLTACVGLAIAWIVGAVALQSSASLQLRSDFQKSAILTELDQLLPPSGPILNALARFDPLPSVHGPAADVPAPTSGILVSPPVRAARRSVVRVYGTACGLGIEGSGWVAADGVVVTNAHVIAGEADTEVQPGGAGPGLPTRVIAFDPQDDIALLQVPGLREGGLTLADNPRSGTAAAILGYPLDGPFQAEPGRIGQSSLVSTEDAYGRGPVLRNITPLRGHVRPGNSGGPMVNDRGQVVATVFAALSATSRQGGFAVPNTIVRRELATASDRGKPVPAGHCAG